MGEICFRIICILLITYRNVEWLPHQQLQPGIQQHPFSLILQEQSNLPGINHLHLIGEGNVKRSNITGFSDFMESGENTSRSFPSAWAGKYPYTPCGFNQPSLIASACISPEAFFEFRFGLFPLLTMKIFCTP